LRVVGDLGQVGAQAVRLRPAPADDDAGPRRVEVDPQPVPGALDLDAAHRRRLQLRHQVVADLPVLHHGVLIVPIVEPPGLPVRGDPQPEPVRVDLLAHYFVLFSSSSPSSAPLSSMSSVVSGRAAASGSSTPSPPASSASPA